MSCENCPNFEECREFALNLNRDSDYKELHPDMIREVERYIEKCKEDCAEWESGGEEYYRNKLNEEIGKSLKWMRDIRTHIENVCSYQSEYLKNNIKVYCVENERRKIFVSELERLKREPQPEPFVMDIRLQSGRAKAMFKAFADKGYIEIVEGGHYKWLVKTRNKKALFGYWLEQAAIHCGIYEPNGKISRLPFERLFDIYDTARNTDQVPQPKGHEEIDRIFNSLS